MPGCLPHRVDACRGGETPARQGRASALAVFITVDPERDTPAILRRYTQAFDPSFIGLVATSRRRKDRIGLPRALRQRCPPGRATMDHTATSYVFDPTGTLRLAVSHTTTQRTSRPTSAPCSRTLPPAPDKSQFKPPPNHSRTFHEPQAQPNRHPHHLGPLRSPGAQVTISEPWVRATVPQQRRPPAPSCN